MAKVASGTQVCVQAPPLILVSRHWRSSYDLQEGTASLNKASTAASTSQVGPGPAVVYSLLGAVRRVMRLAQHQMWSQQLAADIRVCDSLNTIVAVHLEGHPVPGVIVQGALWTQYFLLLSDSMHVHSMAAQSCGAASTGLSQTAVAADISEVAGRARDFVSRVRTKEAGPPL
jgi:hypothetical protein